MLSAILNVTLWKQGCDVTRVFMFFFSSLSFLAFSSAALSTSKRCWSKQGSKFWLAPPLSSLDLHDNWHSIVSFLNSKMRKYWFWPGLKCMDFIFKWMDQTLNNFAGSIIFPLSSESCVVWTKPISPLSNFTWKPRATPGQSRLAGSNWPKWVPISPGSLKCSQIIYWI